MWEMDSSLNDEGENNWGRRGIYSRMITKESNCLVPASLSTFLANNVTVQLYKQ